jgi:5'-nucleotidase (lipoprotein e(P4) family)
MSHELHWVRNSAEHRACFLQGYKLATMLVDKNSAGMTSGSWAVILDGDETVLDNSLYQKELAGGPFNYAKWKEWEKRQDASALPGAAAFLHHVHALGGKIAIVSNRTTETQEYSERLMHKVGLEFDYMAAKSSTSLKDPRFNAIEQGSSPLGKVKVVLYVGDNIQDFPGMRQTIREEGDDAFAAFGEKYVILPNPMYGSWERNPEE